MTLILEPDNILDYNLILDLAKRLNVKVKQNDDLLKYFGAWDDIDAEKMIENIEESRTSKDIDISWIQ